MFLPIATTSDPLILLVDILFLAIISGFVSWYFVYKRKKEILGGFLGGIFLSAFGALILLALMQGFVRAIILWLMSPKIGTVQLSNLNLIVVILGAFLTLYSTNYIINRRGKK